MTQTRTKISVERQALVDRANAAGVSDAIDWKWPEPAIDAVVSQAEAAAAAKKTASQGSSRKRARSPREALLAKAEGTNQARFYHAALFGETPDLADAKEKKFWGYKKPQAECILAILFREGVLSEEFAQSVANRFPDTEASDPARDRVADAAARNQAEINKNA